MPQHTGSFGFGFSPISSEETEEDLPRLLERLFGGPGGVGAGALPAPRVRGVPPDEILRLFLSAAGQIGRRPDISEVLAPEAPAIVEQPEAPPTLPSAEAAPPAEIAPPLDGGGGGGEAPAPAPDEAGLALESEFGGGEAGQPGGGGFYPTQPGTGAEVLPGDPDYGGPLVPRGGGTPPAGEPPPGEELTPEEQEFLNEIFGGGYGGGRPFAV